MTPVSEPRRLTIKQAVTETQSSESTIKRRLLGGAFPHAGQDTDGRWLIPVTDLVAAGLRPGKRANPDPLPTQLIQLENLHAENADLRSRLAVAEAVAGERDRIIGVQERMLRMLEAGRPLSAAEPASAAPVPIAQLSLKPSSHRGRQRDEGGCGLTVLEGHGLWGYWVSIQ